MYPNSYDVHTEVIAEEVCNEMQHRSVGCVEIDLSMDSEIDVPKFWQILWDYLAHDIDMVLYRYYIVTYAPHMYTLVVYRVDRVDAVISKLQKSKSNLICMARC